MKKLLAVLLVAAGGYAIAKKLQSDSQDRDLWAEVTDAVR